MPLLCEDLARHGVVLVPPSATHYPDMVADIERRLLARPSGSPPVDPDALRTAAQKTNSSAILVNNASVAIVSVAYIWWISGRNNQPVPQSHLPGTNPSTLLPFRLNERYRRFHSYWHTIFPGSKRLITSGLSWLGDNTDVRMPEPDELWSGGFISGSGASNGDREALALKLDGVFFEDGVFAGPNKLGSWERTVFAAEAYQGCAALARQASAPDEFFLRVQRLTGYDNQAKPPHIAPPFAWLSSQPLDPEPIRIHERQFVGRQILAMRRTLGDEAALREVQTWADVSAPHFRRL